MALNAQLIMVNVPAKDPKASRDFYSALFGIEFAPAWSDEVEGYHAPVSSDGIKLSVQEPGQGQQGLSCIFAVNNLEEAVQEIEKMGGQATRRSFSMPIAQSAIQAYAACAVRYGVSQELATSTMNNLGRAAVVKDPAGNSMVLVELEEHAHFSFKSGPLYEGLTSRQLKLHNEELQASKSLDLKKIR